MTDNDTIAAIATPPGRGGIAIIRISGGGAEGTLQKLFRPHSPWASHQMYYGHIASGGDVIDECMAVLMRAPKSYTREDVAEIHLHGGEWTARRALDAVFALGARPARPASSRAARL